MIKKEYIDVDVVTMAKRRIKNIFATAPAVRLSVSGGKDSICINDLIFKLCVSGEVDKSKLIVDFIDEEAIYPCVEKITKSMRMQWLSIGVEFRWWCIEVKHFNCFNMLANDESFICWDSTKRDVWVRERPPFALTDHPLLNKRKDKYQDFLPRLNAGAVQLCGVRVSESVQRRDNVARATSHDMLYPIYDWTDGDVWRYIYDNGLDIPNAYIYMYQVGVSKGRMRISQFFSIDTASSLVKMCEFYPHLFDKICKREPNAYMAMLYFDTELFRKSKEKTQTKKDSEIDYKAKTLELLNNEDYFTTETQIKNREKYTRFVIQRGTIIEDNKVWKTIYNALIGGDPKGRTLRALYTNVYQNLERRSK